MSKSASVALASSGISQLKDDVSHGIKPRPLAYGVLR